MTLSKWELTMRQSDGMKSSIILVFEIGPARPRRRAKKVGASCREVGRWWSIFKAVGD
jgi:hypothetical protein